MSTKMPVSETIKSARERKRMTDVQVAEKTGLSIYEYGDLESYDNEAETVLDLKKLKVLCKVLEISLFDMFSLEKPQSNYFHYDKKERNDIVFNRRKALGFTQDELGDKVGFHGYVIQEMESDSEFLESWCLEDVVSLAETLGLPPWVLIGE